MRNVVISSSTIGAMKSPSSGRPTDTAKTPMISTLWIRHSIPSTSIFDSRYAFSERPAMYSRFRMLRSLQTSWIALSIPTQNAEQDKANSRLFVISYCSNCWPSATSEIRSARTGACTRSSSRRCLSFATSLMYRAQSTGS